MNSLTLWKTARHGFMKTNWTALNDPSAAQADGGTVASGIYGGNIVGLYYDASSSHGFLYDGTKGW